MSYRRFRRSRFGGGTVLAVYLACATQVSQAAPSAGEPAVSDTALAGISRAQQALEASRRAMWGRPLQLDCELHIRSESGAKSLLLADVELIPGRPPRSVVELRSALGEPLERLEVRWQASGPKWRGFRGPDFREEVAIDPREHIARTVLRWQDLVLPFLWWTNTHYVGVQEIKGRRSDVVDLIAPPGEHHWSRVRLYVDQQLGVFLRADTFGTDGRRDAVIEAKMLRRLEDDFWIVSRLDITRPGERIILRVREATVGESDGSKLKKNSHRGHGEEKDRRWDTTCGYEEPDRASVFAQVNAVESPDRRG